MTEEERHTIEAFKAGVSVIRTGADGYPIPHEAIGAELYGLSILGLKVATILLGPDDLNAAQRSVLNLSNATSRLIAATQNGDRDPAIPEAWFRARAELIELDD
jgi:hypothetical protein